MNNLKHKLITPEETKFILLLKKIYHFFFNKKNLVTIPTKNNGIDSCIFLEEKINSFVEPNNELKKIFEGSSNFNFIEIYVHGSWADNSKTSFSDLDDLIIIDRNYITKKNKVSLEKWLNTVDRRFCKLDQTQHHGHWIIYKDNLDNYDNSYIPISILKNSICIQGTRKISAKVNINKTTTGLKNNLKNTEKNIENLFSKYSKNKINIFEMKGLIGSIFLACPYIFQIKGKNLSKKEAITNCAEIFSQKSCELIKTCSLIRTNWHYTTGNVKYKILKILALIIFNPHIYRMVAKKISPPFEYKKFPRLTREMLDSFMFDVNKYYD